MPRKLMIGRQARRGADVIRRLAFRVGDLEKTPQGGVVEVTKYPGGGSSGGSGSGGGSPLTVEEADGSPSVANVVTIIFPNGTVTDDGGGIVTYTPASPAGMLLASGATPLTGDWVQSGVHGIYTAGAMRVGSSAAPTNVTAGDLTVSRLLVGADGAFVAGSPILQVGGVSALLGHVAIGGAAVPSVPFVLNINEAVVGAIGAYGGMNLDVQCTTAPSAFQAMLLYARNQSTSGNLSTLAGLAFYAMHESASKNTTTAVGLMGYVGSSAGSGGTFGTAKCFYAQGSFAGTLPGIVYGLHVGATLAPSGVGTAYGVKVDALAATTSYGVDISRFTGTNKWGVRNPNCYVATPSTTQSITAVGNAVLADAEEVAISSGGDYTLTSTPTIANGVTGQRVRITNVGANTVTLQDQGTLAGSNLRLGATTRALGPNDNIILCFNSTVGGWVEAAFTNVV